MWLLAVFNNSPKADGPNFLIYSSGSLASVTWRTFTFNPAFFKTGIARRTALTPASSLSNNNIALPAYDFNTRAWFSLNAVPRDATTFVKPAW